jgi:hypothetical protein
MEATLTAELLSLTSQPLVRDYRTWLRSFFETFPQATEGDTFGSTYTVMGAVILTAVAADCRDVDFLQGLLRLPRRFIGLVIGVMDDWDLWGSALILDLECALRDHANDFVAIDDSLHAMNEELWCACWSEDRGTLLELYRSSYLIGGAVEHWIDDDEPVHDHQVLM